MTKRFVQILTDVHMKWKGSPPVYRVYVNDEMFAERTFIWQDSYLEELLQIEAEPGQYHIRYELTPLALRARLRIRNMRVAHGPGQINGDYLEILDESQ